MCLKIWNGDFLSFAPFKGLQIELTSIVLLPIRKHAGTISSLEILASPWLLWRQVVDLPEWQIAGMALRAHEAGIHSPLAVSQDVSSTHHATMLEGLPQHSPHSTKSDDSDVG